MKKLLLSFFITVSIDVAAQDSTFLIHTLEFKQLTFDVPEDLPFVGIDTSQVSNLWQIGHPQKNILNATWISLPNCIITDTVSDYPANNVSSFTIKTLVSNVYYNFLEVSFNYKIDTDSLLDGGMIEISRDSGQNWTNVINDPYYNFGWGGSGVYTNTDTVSALHESGFSGTSPWSQASFFVSELSPVVDASYWFRFTFASDSVNNAREGWMIDDIQFYGFLEGIQEINTSSLVEIFPNPSSGKFSFINKGKVSLDHLTIIDANGRIVYSSAITGADVDLSFLPDGFYEAIFEGKNVRIVKRLAISH